MSSIGERVKKLREKRGWTQRDFAKKLGISNSVLSRIENGEKKNVEDYLIKRLAETLETSADYLLGLSTSTTPKPSLDDLDMKETENLFFFNRDGMSDEDIEKVKEYIELLRLKAKQYNEKHDK